MLPILSAIPDPIKKQITDSLVEFIANQAEKLASDQVAAQIRKFSSQNDFVVSVEKAIHAGTERFIAEYADQDEDLVDAISKCPQFWNSQSVHKVIIALMKKPGAWAESDRQELATHFEDILPERRNRTRVDQAVGYFLHCVAEELWTLPGAKEVRDVYALQFQKITAESVHEQVALAHKQLEATVQLSTDMRQALMQLTGALEKNLLAAPANTSYVQPKPYNNLPRPDYNNFIGRELELHWLRQRLAPDDRAWQIAITGIGGVGKSALALMIAHEYRENYDRLSAEQRFDAIVWISAKEEVLTISGKERASLPELVLRTLEDVYTAISRALDREDITRALPKDQGLVVEKALKEQRTLLIMDNLESVQDERIKPFLRNLPAPTKAIVTSREWLDVADVLQLHGLPPIESDHLIAAEASTRQVSLSIEQRQRIYDLTSGLPLPIKLAVARMAGGESFNAVENWLGNAVGDLPEYCIQGQADLARKRDPNIWKLLLACSLFDRTAGASRHALGYVAELSIADRDHGLATLQRLFLINHTENDRFWVLPIVQRYASGQFATSSQIIDELVSRWLDWLIIFSEKYQHYLDWKLENLEELGEEYGNILNAIRWCFEQKRWQALLKLAPSAWKYAYRLALFNEIVEVLDFAQVAAVNSGDEKILGEILLQRVRVAMIRQIKLSKQDLKELQQAEKIIFKYGDEEYFAEARTILLDNLRHRKKYKEAEKIGVELFELGLQNKNAHISSMGAERLCQLKAEQHDWDKAMEWLLQAEEMAMNTGSQRLRAATTHRRAALLMDTGQIAEAEALLSNLLETYIKMKDRRFIVYIKRRLAMIYAQTSRLPLALIYIKDAYALAQRIGMEWWTGTLEKTIEQMKKLAD